MSVVTVAATEAYTAANLKTEIQSGPYASTFSPLITASNWVEIASILNDPTQSGAGPVAHGDISGADLLAAIVPAELNTLTSLELQQLGLYTSAPTVHISASNVQAWILQTFPQADAPNSLEALQALATRTGSRAEVLFGAGQIVSNTDVQFAMTGQGTFS